MADRVPTDQWIEFNFSVNMRLRREELGWNQAELSARLKDAGLAHMHQTTVPRIEKGERSPRLGEAEVIADVMGTSLSLLRLNPEVLKTYLDVSRLTWNVHRSFTRVTEEVEILSLDRDLLDRGLVDVSPDREKFPELIEEVVERAKWALEKLTIENAVNERHVDPEHRLLGTDPADQRTNAAWPQAEPREVKSFRSAGSGRFVSRDSHRGSKKVSADADE